MASLLEWVFLIPLFVFFLLKDGENLKNMGKKKKKKREREKKEENNNLSRSDSGTSCLSIPGRFLLHKVAFLFKEIYYRLVEYVLCFSFEANGFESDCQPRSEVH